MGQCMSIQGRDTSNDLKGKAKHSDARECSSLLERNLSTEQSVWFLTRHHKKGLFDLPYRLHGGIPNVSQTTKDIIDASKEDGGIKRRQREKKLKGADEEWMRDISQRYELISTLGIGGTSTVWLAKDCTSREEVAIKVFKRPISSKDVPMLYNELLVGSQSWFDDTIPAGRVSLDSVFLCHSRSVFLTQHCYGVVMEVARGGNLAEYVSATCGKHVTSTNKPSPLAIDEEQARFVYRQLLRGIRHMHEDMKTAHRDIKLDNTVIMNSWTTGNTIGTLEHCIGRVAFVDFQYAYHYEQNSPMIQCKDLLGTPVYMSPELLALRFDSSHHLYDPISSDIWASGILLVAMLFGTFPFDDAAPKNMEDLEKAIFAKQKTQSWKEAKGIAPFLNSASSECVNLLDSILQIDPSKRSSLSQIEMHPWIKKPFESKSLESGWKQIEKEIQSHREDVSCSLVLDESTKQKIAAVVHARNAAVKQLIDIASHAYDKDSSVLHMDSETLADAKSHKEWEVFHSHDIVGLVDHHSFSDEQCLEISMDMKDVYIMVGRNE